MWVVSQLHLKAFSFIVSQAIATATDAPPVLAEPTLTHVWAGRQTFALAYDSTSVSLNLPFEAGEAIDVTVYDLRGTKVLSEEGTAYRAPLTVQLEKGSLLVVEPAK